MHEMKFYGMKFYGMKFYGMKFNSILECVTYTHSHGRREPLPIDQCRAPRRVVRSTGATTRPRPHRMVRADRLGLVRHELLELVVHDQHERAAHAAEDVGEGARGVVAKRDIECLMRPPC